jgi:lipopolysaccharide/colanic/teichoic acid biosynthesis glycosyltransferase
MRIKKMENVIDCNTIVIVLDWISKKLDIDWLAKRFFDMFVSGIILLVLSPFLLLVILWIRLDSQGAVLFPQTRVGKGGKLFTMWKFRSMYIDAEKRQVALMKDNEMKGGILFKMKEDPRITPVGRLIRKFSIDELPQLWNVFSGDMSLVGPRPPLPSEVTEYTAYQRRRLEATPGITCVWQISGRSDIPFVQQVDMDLAYIASQSFWGDIALLLKTIPAVLTARGAY